MTAPESLENSLLDRCPHCGYSLTGLPTRHRCPECGHEVDRRWQVFGGRAMFDETGRRRTRDPVRFMLVMPILYSLVAAALVLILPGPRDVRPILVVTALVTGALLLVGRYLFSIPRSFITLGPDGLGVRHRKRSEVYAWADVGRAQYDLLRKSIVFPYRGEKVQIHVEPVFRTAMAEVDRCLQAINRYPRESAECSAIFDVRPSTFDQKGV